MRKPEDQALELCIQYSELLDRIRPYADRIGGQIVECMILQASRAEGTSNLLLASPAPTHLSVWYKVSGVPRNSQQICEHCHEAHQLVLERKKLKRQLGATKGLIRQLGRKSNVTRN